MILIKTKDPKDEAMSYFDENQINLFDDKNTLFKNNLLDVFISTLNNRGEESMHRILFWCRHVKSSCPGGKHDAFFLQKNVIRDEWKMSPIWYTKLV